MQLLSMISKTPVVICHSSQRHSTHIVTYTHTHTKRPRTKINTFSV